ncbi:MAG: ATP:cob(I)alamin adenosyltransferase [Akkermansiaceae bacterium]
MSIITKGGDNGETDAMYGGRVSKLAPEVVAVGAVDELNTALGVVRVSGIPREIEVQINTVQDHLVSLMGLLSVPAAKRDKYLADGFANITAVEVDWLETIAVEMPTKFDGWARPGAAGNVGAAWVDMARTICRRAELAAWGLGDGAHVASCQFLNRLSDILWLWARKLEKSE